MGKRALLSLSVTVETPPKVLDLMYTLDKSTLKLEGGGRISRQDFFSALVARVHGFTPSELVEFVKIGLTSASIPWQDLQDDCDS